MSFFSKIFGDSNARALSEIKPLVNEINSKEEEVAAFSDDVFKKKTGELKECFAKTNSFDAILPEAFALVREASRRTIGLRHFDVQLIGGIVLHQGRIAEMKTGEGKTLVATLPLYVNSLAGKGVHLVAPNEYLARVGGGWMGPVYHLLGVSVGVVTHGFSGIYDPAYVDPHDHGDDRLNHWRPVSRVEAYAADITYATNNELGFDYLRDNLARSKAEIVMRPLFYAVVDEIDSILIDEARTPLIISAPDEDSGNLYGIFARIAPLLKEGIDYTVDEKMKAASITEAGIDKVESLLNVKDIYSEGGIRYVHHLEQALRAQALYHRDKDYVVKDGEVIIVDQFTGRLMPGRRWSDGLHQAIEAKEGVRVEKESRTVASITFQNYFRMYEKLSGMTGTAATSAEEFHKVYNLDVVIIPTHKPLIRKDLDDRIYQTEEGKLKAIVREVKERNSRGQPILIGTVSIEKNELISAFLKKEGITHEVLNAKNHEREAQIIAQAGRLGSVTVATNMAGRGVDIILGGNPPSVDEAAKVREAGGLFVLGTERHEARRIDNQLRGRSGRQGDPGVTQFFVSLEDDLMRIFGSDRIKGMMGKFGIPEDMPIEHSLVSRAINSAQEKIEGFNFDSRKHVLEYDDVLNKQRTAIYALRKKILFGDRAEVEKIAREMLEDEMKSIVENHIIGDNPSEWNIDEIFDNLKTRVNAPESVRGDLAEITKRGNDIDTIRQAIFEYVQTMWENLISLRTSELGEELFIEGARSLLLQIIDMSWANHLEMMEYMRSSVRLRAYGQRDPLIEYKNEGFKMFREMQESIKEHFSHMIFRMQITPAQERARHFHEHHPQAARIGQSNGLKQPSEKFSSEKVGRNDPCPCGSGKKYKKCHGV